jgi:hypothetical protein
MYQLPPGGTGVALTISHPAGTLEGSTMSTQVVYGVRTPGVPAPASSTVPAVGFSCTVGADGFNSLYGEMDAYAHNSCTGNNYAGLSKIDLGTCLDWLNSQGNWVQQDCEVISTGQAPWFLDGVASHSCAVGQVHYWRDRANGHYWYDGKEITELPNSYTQGVKCND